MSFVNTVTDAANTGNILEDLLQAMPGSAATNMGAMFRWRMQALPFLLAFLTYGLSLHGRGYFYRLMSRWGN